MPKDQLEELIMAKSLYCPLKKFLWRLYVEGHVVSKINPNINTGISGMQNQENTNQPTHKEKVKYIKNV